MLYAKLSSCSFMISFCFQLFAAGAPISYAFSVVVPKENGSIRKSLVLMVGLPTLILCGLSFLYTNMLKG